MLDPDRRPVVGDVTGGSRRKVVSIGICVPYDDVDHAGGRYLSHLYGALSAFATVTCVAPDVADNRHAAAQPGAPRVVLVGRARSRRPAAKVVSYALFRIDRLAAVFRPVMPPLPITVRLACSLRLHTIIADADVIDLQWSEYARLAPLMRWINPRALIIGTFHDVLGQVFARSAAHAGTPAVRRRFKRLAEKARRVERRAVRHLDGAVVFSEKDRELLGHDERVRVVYPAMQDVAVPRARASTPTCIFLGNLRRPENADAASWLLSEIWPRVVDALPHAELEIIGSGADAPLRRLVDDTRGARLAGFVEDLGGALAAAWVAVVPVRRGAGVKFKSLECLIAGLPTVATSVGAEGIEPRSAFAAVHDDAAGLSLALIDVLTDPEAAERRVAAPVNEVRGRYSITQFSASLRDVYGIDRRS